MIYQYRTCLDFYDEEMMEKCLSWFPVERVDNILKISNLQGRREKVAAYVLLVDMLKEEGLLRDLPRIVYAENGKPFLANYPDVHFNMSHCRNAVAVALHDAPVGIDVESRRSVSRAVVERVCCRQELSVIDAAVDPEMEFLRLWTQKEALLKCTGVGIRDNMRDILVGNTEYQIITEELPAVEGFVSVCCSLFG